MDFIKVRLQYSLQYYCRRTWYEKEPWCFDVCGRLYKNDFDVIPSKGDTVWYNDVPWNIFEETPGKKDTVSYECLNGEWSNFKITD
ncbi:hypothetical protein [Fibrobacter succinogenes]|uniref:hypothetical protein n=1 Tax=Fibrobacter succinogenes TaxID=833 RepID=UPI0013CF6DE1|nr:hypothetical protein [Fibrobacter succinogenes]